MLTWGNDYDPDQMLKFATVNPFDCGHSDKLNHLVTQILSTIVVEKNPKELSAKIAELIYEYSNVSIGQSLEKLHTVATTGNELNYNRDGLDALCYHLSSYTAENGIKALQAVLRRFDDLKEMKAAEAFEKKMMEEQKSSSTKK